MDCFSRVQGCFSRITVEPCMFFFALCNGMFVIIAQNLYIAKVCEVNLGFDKSICDNITHNKVEQVAVQKYVSELQAYSGVLQALPSVVYALFAGPWSDLHGRKTLIVCSAIGYLINNTVFIINTYWFYELKAEYLLFECLQDCTGGHVVFWLACYSYITDISQPNQRTKRLAFLDGMFPAGFFIGMGMSGFIKSRLGYYGNFGLGIAMICFCLTYTIFFLKDSPKLIVPAGHQVEGGAEFENRNVSQEKGLLKSIFDVENVKSAFKTTFKKRENNMRTYIIVIGIVFLLEIFLITGKGPTMYLYFRKHFSWDAEGFGMYIGIFGILGIFAQYVIIPFMSNYLKLQDMTIALIAISGVVIQNLIVCFTPPDKIIFVYIASFFSLLSICITTVCRSLISKCVKPWEIGKVFSVIGGLQAMVPLVSNPVYGFLYKSTVDTFAGAFLIFNVWLYVILTILVATVSWRMDQTVKTPLRTDATERVKLNTPPETETDGSDVFRFNNELVKVERKY